jgi:hypothetical protein
MFINKEHGSSIAFCDLMYGDAFMYSNQVYIKVCNTNDLNNAVNLEDGDICHFHDEQTVYLVDYEFTIK